MGPSRCPADEDADDDANETGRDAARFVADASVIAQRAAVAVPAGLPPMCFAKKSSIAVYSVSLFSSL